MKALLITIAVLFPAFGAGNLHGITSRARQNGRSPSASEKSYRRGRLVLDAGLRALGGTEALRSIQDVTLREVGKQHHVNQSVSPYPPFSSALIEDATVIDFRRNRFSRELRNSFPGESAWVKTVISGAEGYSLDLRSKTMRPIPNASVANQRGQFRKLPHLVLFEALERVHSLRWLGEDAYRGRRQRVITYVRPDGQQAALYFDARTNLLTKYDLLYTDNVFGDAVQEHIFPAYRSLGRFKVPTGRVMTFAGHVWQEVEYADLRFDSRPADSLFKVPTDFERLAAAAPSTTGAVKLSDDVYLLQGASHNSMFVAFDDYVLVIDAPEPSPPPSVSEGFIAEIKKTVPGKPIRYLVLTHHHGDHAGGARAYIAEGTTLITTPGNQRFFEQLVAAPFTVVRDALARRPRHPAFELIENKKRVFRDAKHLVELYDIGPSPHAAEMVVAYLPRERILFQSDLFTAADDGTAAAQDSTVHLAEMIERLDLRVEKIVGGHGAVTTSGKLRAALEKRRLSDVAR